MSHLLEHLLGKEAVAETEEGPKVVDTYDAVADRYTLEHYRMVTRIKRRKQKEDRLKRDAKFYANRQHLISNKNGQ